MLKCSTQAKVFWYFPFIYFILLHVNKNNKKFTQFAAELKQLCITIAAAFRFGERACFILANEK